jgi:hypothetical protein
MAIHFFVLLPAGMIVGLVAVFVCMIVAAICLYVCYRRNVIRYRGYENI